MQINSLLRDNCYELFFQLESKYDHNFALCMIFLFLKLFVVKVFSS